MPLIQARIPTLLGGVSQQPPALRDAQQLEEQINGLSRVSDGGPSKRPGSSYLGKVTSAVTGFATAFVHAMNLSETQRYLVTIANDTLRVFDALTGLPQAVQMPSGDGYVAVEPADDIDILADTFTDANATQINNHVADVGASWVLVTATASDLLINNNRLEAQYPGASDDTIMLDFPVPTDDYTVSKVSKVLSNGGSVEFSYLIGRGNLSNEAGYALGITYNPASPGVVLTLYRVAADGTTTTLDATTVAGKAGTDDHEYGLRFTGNYIEGLVDGVSVVDIVDSTYPTGRYCGLHFRNTNTSDRRASVAEFRITYASTVQNTQDQYRAVTVDDRTYIVNTTKTVQRSTEKAPTQTPTALLYVDQADYGTTYAVTIDGQTISYETTAGTDAATRRQIATNEIASALRELLLAAFSSYSFDQFGSLIRVQRTDGGAFTISGEDGLADNGLVVLKDTVQRATDLPLRCVDGYVLEVAGGPEDASDSYWVKFDADGSDDFRGVWRECARPGEGISFDVDTLPHELVFSDELSEEMAAKGFPKMPVVMPRNPVKDYESWNATLNGADISNNAFPNLSAHNDDFFVNLEDTNGGPIKVGVKYLVNTTRMTAGETLILTIAYNDGVASTSWTTAKTLTFTPGIYLTGQVTEVDIAAAIGANYDLRVQVTYASGSTPASPGTIILAPNQQGIWYYNYSAQDVTWPTLTVYPKGTVWRIDVDAANAQYTQTSDMTGAAIAAAIEPTVEALSGISSSVVVNETGTAVRITKDAGGLPVVTVSKTFSAATHFWNPELNLEDTTDTFVGKTLRNLSDGSEGTITASYATGVTVSALTGGTDNEFSNGDLCVIVDSAKRWMFRPMRWKDRAAGDSVTNPWPSMRDRRISEIFYHRGRLGLLAGGNVVLSEAGVPENLFRTATTQLLDSDPIDVKLASAGTSQFTAAVEWDGRMLLFTDSAQYELTGEPILTPSSVSVKLLTRYTNAPIRPVVLGARVYFARSLPRYTRVFEYRRAASTDRPDAEDITLGVPRYLVGTPQLIAGDVSLGLLAVRTSDDPSDLYVCSIQHSGDERVQTAWSRWEFDPSSQIVGMEFSDGKLRLLMYRADGIFLESLDLDEVATAGYLLDRQMTSDTTGVSAAYSAPNTTWTLPITVATDGSEGTIVVIDEDGNVLTTTRPTSTTVRASGDYTAQTVTIGLQYTFRVDLSTLYMRDQNGRAETRGRTQVRSVTVFFADTRDFTATVTNAGRPALARVYDEDAEQTGELRIPVQSKNDQTTVSITNTTPFPTRLTGLSWEGYHTARGQRV